MRNTIHFLYVPFVGLGLYKGFRGDYWLKNRIKIFKHFVIPALMNQTKLEFIVWISWTEQMRTNPIVQRFMEHLDMLQGMRFVHTFGGICFYDDKYPPEIAKKRLMESLKTSLPELKSWIPNDTDYVLMTIQPSDDLYLSHVVKEVHDIDYKEGQVLGYKQGYIMKYDTLEMAEYNPTTIPPFFTIVFKPGVFLNPEAHFKYTGPYESHEYVKDFLEFIELKGRGFVVGIHGENISTGFNHPFKGIELTTEEAEKILIQTGLYLAEPLILEKDLKRKVMKKLLNILPRFIQYQIIRFLSPGITEKVKSYKWFNI